MHRWREVSKVELLSILARVELSRGISCISLSLQTAPETATIFSYLKVE